MSGRRFTDALLDEKRTRGDALADRTVRAVFEKGELASVNRLMRSLVENDGVPSGDLPGEVREYLEAVPDHAPVEREIVIRGERIFELFGPEILMVLGAYALPAAYAARKGVQVLYRTGYLLRRPIRRLFETTQMVVDVLSGGGLDPKGKGIRTAQKVRLMHATVRHLTLVDEKQPWDAQRLGVPINQEDLAATLMTFSYLVIDGLKKLGIPLEPHEQEDYLAVWIAVGHLMGIDEDLFPRDVAEARELTKIIHARQIHPSEEGRAMTAALVDAMEEMTPAPFAGMSASMIHHFLDADLFTKENIAAELGVPPANWTRHVIQLMALVGRVVRDIADDDHAAVGVRFFSKAFVEGLLVAERGGNRASFDLPDHLRRGWQVAG